MNRKDEVQRVMVAGGLFLVSVVMAAISWFILPEAVMMQFPGLSTGAPAFPKFLAILIAFAFSAVFSLLSVKYEEGVKYTLIGYCLHVLYWICNL